MRKPKGGAQGRAVLNKAFHRAPSAHIGIPLSGVAVRAHLSFFGASPDSKFLNLLLETWFCRDPATRRSRKARQCAIAIA
ncbi:MAG TPA: hypothetical protein VHJ00_11270 [Bradyrhizobium sp.]|nr:hypothetical protein [Bradyrhizobium sp.]